MENATVREDANSVFEGHRHRERERRENTADIEETPR
jgi:hypothetical protein